MAAAATAGIGGLRPPQLVDLDRGLEALHGHRAQRRDLDVPLRESQRVGGDEAPRPPVASCSTRAARCVVWPTARVVHVEIAADGPDHNRARVQSDPNLERDTP